MLMKLTPDVQNKNFKQDMDEKRIGKKKWVSNLISKSVSKFSKMPIHCFFEDLFQAKNVK